MGCLPNRDHVVLLHGLGRGPKIMDKMATYLDAHGFCPHNLDYPSTKEPIEKLTERILNQIMPLRIDKAQKIHFVGHSLGAIIIRYLLQNNVVENLGRVVLIAPPHHGSEVVDFMSKFSLYRAIYGPAGLQLGTKNNDLLQSLDSSTDYDIGIIAGDRSIDKLFSWFILTGQDDGKVTVESTKLEEMTDHIVVHAAHPFLPQKAQVIQQTTYFLANGFFQEL